jgi:hypothetical protein
MPLRQSGRENRRWSGLAGTELRTVPRELIDTGTDKRYIRRDEHGRFKESDDVGRSLSQDRRRNAKNEAKKGEGDRGDGKG